MTKTMTQREAALQRANEIRLAQYRLRSDLRSREQRLVNVLRDLPPELESMKLYNALLAVPQYGQVKTEQLMKKIGIAPSKTLGGLTDRQKNAVIEALDWR